MDIYLDGENISTGGTAEFIKCVNCGHEGIALQLFSDTDTVYQGVIGTGVYNAYGRLTGRQLSARLSETFHREDLESYKSRHFIKSDGDKVWAKICPTCDSYFELIRSMDLNSS